MPGGLPLPRVPGPPQEPMIDMDDWRRRQAEAKLLPKRDELQEQIDLIRWIVGDAPQAPAPEPEPEPESHFADLMLADETLDDAKARLSQRLRELRHYLIAPEIKVNEDGSVGLTAGEQAELQDLERRQTLGRWLEA
jgi:hypothetical protein